MALLACAPLEDAGWPPTRPRDVETLYAEHRRDGAFFNPWPPAQQRTLGRVLRWWLTPGAFEKGEPQLPVVPNDGGSLRRRAERPELTWIGHASVAIHEGQSVVLTDPHFGPRALIPRRAVAPGVPLAAIPAQAMAVISHSHYDHLDAFSVEQLPETVRWFVPLGLGEFFRERGRAVVELDWWQSAEAGGWTFTCLPSQHWSLRWGQSVNETLWCSWLIDSGAHRYFFAGDTGYFHGFAEIGRRFGPIDVALLPIGAYEPRWFMRYQHLNPEEAYRAFLELGAGTLLPIHWGTFDLTDEPLDLPPRALREAIVRAGGELGRAPVLAIGQTWRMPRPVGPAPAAPGD